ncbi:MAG TPA: alpha/beta hydrolase [Urbifossiella sp.]|jgi:acetyl esterase/lipase|nr:alpha/beta hydrolase [Urbifossiella sp.]
MRRLLFVAALAALVPAAGPAADPSAVIDLWPGKAPGEAKDIGSEKLIEPKPGQADVVRLTNVSRPSIAVYPAPKDKATGAAVIVAPGGGYSILAIEHEGTQVCEWLNTLGVTAFLLKYRVPKRDMQMPDNLAAVQDAQRAVSLVRSKAADWKLDPNRVGMLGFSAGGNLTAWACLAEKRMYDPLDDADKQPSRPNFAALIYPAYLTDKGGDLKPEYRVTKDSPPMFFAHASDDPVTPVGSVALYAALKKAGVPAEVHIYATGGHGFGMRKSANPVSTWPARCGDWLKSRGYLDAKK